MSLLDRRSESRWLRSLLRGDSDDLVRLVINSQIIPEPEEYALVFALFALNFVIIRHHWEKKHCQSTTL